MKRIIVALLALCTLALTACSTTLHLVPGTVVNVAETATLVSLNPDVVTTDSAQHLADEVANLTTEGFYTLDQSGVLVANPSFGTVTVESQDPLTVTYEIAQGRKWSDGQPVDSADLVLSFAAATNPEKINFYSRRTGNGLSFAKIKSIGLRSLTLEFSQPVSDFKAALTVDVAAHAVAHHALEGIAATAGKAAIIEAVQGQDAEKLAKFADSYRSAFAVDGDRFTMSALVSNGAYAITSVSSGASVSLKAVKKYKGAFPAVAEKVNVNVYGDSMAALADMNANKIDIIGATESGLVKYPDLIGMVSSLSTTKATTELRNGASADMVVFNFAKGGAFRSSLPLRKAFMSLVPKAKIVQSAASSTQVSASDSFVFPNNSDYYTSSVSSNGSENYLLQDVEKSSELVNNSGVRTPIDVRVVYDSSNPRSVAEYKAISARAASAGFNLIDSSSNSPSRQLLAGDFDVYIGLRPLVAVPGQNPAGLVADPVTSYTDPKLSALLVEYAKASKEINQAGILEQMDARLYANGYGIPLYQVPNLIIYKTKLSSLVVSPFGDSATWGYWTWSVSSK